MKDNVQIQINWSGGEKVVVLGIADPWIWGGYILCIFATLLCVVYGIVNWNKGGEDEDESCL